MYEQNERYSSNLNYGGFSLNDCRNLPHLAHPMYKKANQNLCQTMHVGSNHVTLDSPPNVLARRMLRIKIKKQGDPNSSITSSHRNFQNHVEDSPSPRNFTTPLHTLQAYTKKLPKTEVKQPSSPFVRSSFATYIVPNEGRSKYWTIPNTNGNIVTTPPSSPNGPRKEGRLHYYVIGTTKDG